MDREERLARNEDLFRDANERLASTAVSWGLAEGELEILCECADIDCAERLVVSQALYAHARSESTLFLVKLSHVRTELEEIAERQGDVALVRKVGEAGEVARETDD